jgi:capsular exopolysaccharide synthesis family protein
MMTVAMDWLRELWSSAPAEAAEAPGADETEAQSRVIDAYLDRLRVTPVRNSRLVDVAFVTPDAQLSARIVNEHAAAYIDQNLEFKFLASKEAADWLAARMKEQRDAVEKSEEALQRYREQTGAVALEDRQNIVIQRLTELNAAVTRARTDRIEKEAVYDQVRNLQADSAAIDTVPQILGNAFIQQQKAELANLQRQRAQMAEKLGAKHPDMVKLATAIETTQKRIEAEIQKVVLALRNDYEAALSNERALQAALNQQRQEAQELNRAAIQYGQLERDAEANRQLFQGLLQRTRETDISADLKTNNIRVVDAAEPPLEPSSPNRRTNLLLGLVGGLMLGIGLAFFFEYVDARIKSPEEIKGHLGLPCLGIVPAIRLEPGQSDPLLSSATPHVFVEAIKSVRTNLLFSSAEETAKAVVVTSTGPGEGKTVVAVNLAIALAQAGQRVLLMDCDMRRPRVHALIGSAQEPGLSNVMVGNAKATEAVQKTSVPNLWVLPSGKHPPNPAELLGSKRFREFMKNLSEHFDWIVLDSPPVMAVTDAVVVSHFAHGVVYVVGAEMTTRQAAKQALDQLEATKVAFFGAVLNKVDLQKNAFYYQQYYRREYAEYYQRG